MKSSPTIRRNSPPRAARPTAVSTPGSAIPSPITPVAAAADRPFRLLGEGGTAATGTAPKQMDAIARPRRTARPSGENRRRRRVEPAAAADVARRRDPPALWRALRLDRRRRAQRQSRSRHHLPSPAPRSNAVPRQCALDPDRAGKLQLPRRSRFACAISARLHINMTGAQLPAGHLRRPFRHSRRGEERRGVLSDHAWRQGRRERCAARYADRGPQCLYAASGRCRRRTSPRPISRLQTRRTNCSSIRSNAPASSRPGSGVYAAR